MCVVPFVCGNIMLAPDCYYFCNGHISVSLSIRKFGLPCYDSFCQSSKAERLPCSRMRLPFIRNSCVCQSLMTIIGLLTLSNPIFLPTAYSPALIYFGQERGTTTRIQCTIICSHQNTRPAEKQKEYILRYLLAKVRTT